MGLFNFLTQEIAMDLGTANTLIIHNDEIVVNEPSIVALDRNNPKNVLAVGKRALMMHEKTHESIRTVRPLKDGVIADFNAAELMIRGEAQLVGILVEHTADHARCFELGVRVVVVRAGQAQLVDGTVEVELGLAIDAILLHVDER